MLSIFKDYVIYPSSCGMSLLQKTTFISSSHECCNKRCKHLNKSLYLPSMKSHYNWTNILLSTANNYTAIYTINDEITLFIHRNQFLTRIIRNLTIPQISSNDFIDYHFHPIFGSHWCRKTIFFCIKWNFELVFLNWIFFILYSSSFFNFRPIQTMTLIQYR